MPSHATLSASASKRWTECTPSARLYAQAEEIASPYALEGTDAHSLGQYLIEKEFIKWDIFKAYNIRDVEIEMNTH
jgi:hypothetical protein